MALASILSAYLDSNSIVIVTEPSRLSSMLSTYPTLTPDISTGEFSMTVPASLVFRWIETVSPKPKPDSLNLKIITAAKPSSTMTNKPTFNSKRPLLI